MTSQASSALQIHPVLDRLISLVDTPETTARAEEITSRLNGPLRIAIAGRVKAGKSTLLNALVGERLAPTDAGECTKVVTWYRHGTGYDVTAVLGDGDRTPVPFRRERDRLVMDIGSLDLAQVTRLDVTWPSARLRRFTLIDTPGLEAHDEVSAARTRSLLGIGDDERSEVDAVVYLMRHAHRLDVEFLEAFTDRTLAHPSPVNAIAVLSRADEIGAGRSDALESAAAIATRYASDARIRSLCATVVPVASLIAETGRTLQENEGGSLRALAALPGDESQPMVMSVDRFVDPERSPLDSRTRRDLLLRLGMFGVRLGINQMREPGATTSELARELVVTSGIDRLTALLDDHFGRRAALLKTRSAIANVKAMAAAVPDSAEARDLQTDIERMEAAAPELSELRLLHLVVSGAAGFNDHEVEEVDRLVSDDSHQFRLGMPGEATSDELQAVIVDRLDGWRRLAAFPLASAERREACELVATTYERLHAELNSPKTYRDLQ